MYLEEQNYTILKESFLATSLFSTYLWQWNYPGLQQFVAAKEMHDPSMVEAEFLSLKLFYDDRIPTAQPLGILKRNSKFFLIMDFLSQDYPIQGKENSLISSLRKLYKPKDFWGFEFDNFIGSLPQKNGRFTTFSEFWIQSRILPMIQIIRKTGILLQNDKEILKILKSAITKWNLDDSRPFLIHGDLWSGNILFSKSSAHFIDPAISFGHPEQDFAMLDLFGSVLSDQSKTILLNELHLEKSHWKERIPFWQIYPLLVHVGIFGSSYLPALEQALRDVEKYC